MKSDTKEVGKNTLIYGLGNALNKLLGFILIPVYTSYISISDFGVLAVLEVSVIGLIQLLNLGITSGHQRYFIRMKKNNEYGPFLFSNYFVLFLFSFISVLIIIFFKDKISFLLFNSVIYNNLIILIALIIGLELLSIIPFQILQFELKPFKYISLSFVKLLISLLFTIYYVVFKKNGIEGVLMGRFIGLFVVVLIQILVIIIPRIKIKFDFSLVFDSIKFGFPIIFSTIGYLIFSMSDIYMLNKLSTNSDVGMYSFGYKIANFINLVFIQSIGISYLPSLYEKEDKKNNKVFYSKMLLFYVIIISSIILLFILTYRYILDFIIFNKEYSIGLIIVPIISLGFLIKGMNNFINVGIFLKNKTKFFIISSFVTAVFNISLNLFMIPKYGFIGAAFATLLSQILNTFMLSVFSYKIFKINFKWKKVLLIIFFISILLIINELTNNIVGFYTILIQVLLIISFFIFLYIIILSKDEQKQILSLIKRINSKR